MLRSVHEFDIADGTQFDMELYAPDNDLWAWVTITTAGAQVTFRLERPDARAAAHAFRVMAASLEAVKDLPERH
jgi:hypothetical protein